MKQKFDSKNLIDKYADMIFGISIGYLKIKEDAEDIVQEVFIKYIEYIQSDKNFENEEHEKSWLIRVTINLCCNYLKRYKTYNKLINEKVFNDTLDEDERNLLDNIDKLNEKYRTVFELFYIRDLKISEISRILKISEANVKTRLRRARNKISKYMQLGADENSEKIK